MATMDGLHQMLDRLCREQTGRGVSRQAFGALIGLLTPEKLDGFLAKAEDSPADREIILSALAQTQAVIDRLLFKYEDSMVKIFGTGPILVDYGHWSANIPDRGSDSVSAFHGTTDKPCRRQLY